MTSTNLVNMYCMLSLVVQSALRQLRDINHDRALLARY